LLELGDHALLEVLIVVQSSLTRLAFHAKLVSTITAPFIRVVEGSADATNTVSGVMSPAFIALVAGVVLFTASAAHPFHDSSLPPLLPELEGIRCLCFFSMEFNRLWTFNPCSRMSWMFQISPDIH
jgi:hypothetical protein